MERDDSSALLVGDGEARELDQESDQGDAACSRPPHLIGWPIQPPVPGELPGALPRRSTYSGMLSYFPGNSSYPGLSILQYSSVQI